MRPDFERNGDISPILDLIVGKLNEPMRVLRTLDEANEVTAIRLTARRRFAKVGDLFRLSPYEGVFLWGRLIKRSQFFGNAFESNLVYIYDVVSAEQPKPESLDPSNLIIGPSVVNNLGWVRGYWDIVASPPLLPADTRKRHLFVRYHGTGRASDYDLVDEHGNVVTDRSVDPQSLAQAGYGNFNLIDWLVRDILEGRGVIPRNAQ